MITWGASRPCFRNRILFTGAVFSARITCNISSFGALRALELALGLLVTSVIAKPIASYQGRFAPLDYRIRFANLFANPARIISYPRGYRPFIT